MFAGNPTRKGLFRKNILLSLGDSSEKEQHGFPLPLESNGISFLGRYFLDKKKYYILVIVESLVVLKVFKST